MASLYLPIIKFILALKLEFYKPQLGHLFTLVHGIILCAGRKKITQIQQAARGDRHLSNITNFLNHSPWCVNRMQRRRMQFVMDKIRAKRAKSGDARQLVFFIIDDTCCKKEPSTKKMEALSFQYSHEANIQRLVKKELNPYLRGWGRYFGAGDVKSRFRDTDSWIRRRLRAVQLRIWKKVRKLHREIRRRGWNNKELPGLRMTAWRSSNSTYAQYAMPNKWFVEIGLYSLLDIYKELHPQRG